MSGNINIQVEQKHVVLICKKKKTNLRNIN